MQENSADVVNYCTLCGLLSTVESDIKISDLTETYSFLKSLKYWIQSQLLPVQLRPSPV